MQPALTALQLFKTSSSTAAGSNKSRTSTAKVCALTAGLNISNSVQVKVQEVKQVHRIRSKMSQFRYDLFQALGSLWSRHAAHHIFPRKLLNFLLEQHRKQRSYLSSFESTSTSTSSRLPGPISTTLHTWPRIYLVWKSMLYLWLWIATARAVGLSAAMATTAAGAKSSNSSSQSLAGAYFRWDPLPGSIWLLFPKLPSRVVTTGALLPLYTTVTDFLLYHWLDSGSLRLFHELCLCSSDNDSNDSNSNPNSSKQTNSRNPENASNSSLASNNTNLCPRLTASTRRRVSLLATLGDLFVALVVFSGVFISFPLAAIYHELVYLQYYQQQSDQGSFRLLSIPKRILFALELLISAYSIWDAVRVTLFGLYYFGVMVFAMGDHLRHWHNRLHFTVHASRAHQVGRARSAQVWGRVQRRYHRHWVQTFRLARNVNRRLFSPCSVMIIATVMPINVFILANLIRLDWDRLGPAEFLLMATLAIGQPVIMAAVCFVATVLPDRLYGSHGVLFQAQGLVLNRGDMRAKMKLLVVHELTCTWHKFQFTVGPSGKVTKQAIVEFFVVYSAMLMFAFNLYGGGKR